MKKSTKKISFFIALTMLISAFSSISVSAANFYDTGYHWAQAVIDKWSNYGVVNGYEGYFRPDDNINRAEVAQVMQNIMSYKDTAANMYNDVKNTDWYADAILKLVAAGALSGDADGNMFPEQYMTRQDAITMLCRAMGLRPKSGYVNRFTDANQIASYALESINALASNGYINGYYDGGIHPQASITRAEFLQIVDNVIGLYVTSGGIVNNQRISNIVMLKTGGVDLTNVSAAGVIISQSAYGNVNISGCSFSNDVVNHSRSVTVTYDGRSQRYFNVDFYVDKAFYAGRYVEEGKYISPIPSNPRKSGYTFEGWFISEKYAKNLDRNGYFNPNTTPITSDISLYAGFSQNYTEKCSVNFYVNNSFYDSRSVTKGNYISNVPADPINFGGEFKGWFTSKSAADNLNYNYYFDVRNQRINKDMALYAGFSSIDSPTIYDITFYDNDSVYATSTAQSYCKIQNVPKDPIRLGASFEGWFTNKQAAENLNYNYHFDVHSDVVTHNMELYSGFSQVVAPTQELQHVAINTNSPEVGETLTATVYPTDAKNSVTYTWYVVSASTGEVQVSSGSNNTYRVKDNDEGYYIKVECTPDPGSQFTGSVSDRTSNPVYNPTKRDLSVSLHTSHGGSAVLSSSSPKESDTVTITATPYEGYIVNNVIAETESGRSILVQRDGMNRYKFTMPEKDVNVYVDFIDEGFDGVSNN